MIAKNTYRFIRKHRRLFAIIIV